MKKNIKNRYYIITACWQAKSLAISCKFSTILPNLANLQARASLQVILPNFCHVCTVPTLQATVFARSCKFCQVLHRANIAREWFCKIVQILQFCTRLQTKLQRFCLPTRSDKFNLFVFFCFYATTPVSAVFV